MALLRAREAVMARFRPILRDQGLTEQQWRIIRALEGENDLDISTLADRTLLLMPSLTRILSGMEEAELIRRVTDAHDARRRRVRLSRKGRTVFRHVAPLSEAAYAEIEAGLPGGQLSTLYSLLDALEPES
ncbi:MAG: homoprotocatechuate degradation operon regulator HpaR [Pseudomonadota bacterium]